MGNTIYLLERLDFNRGWPDETPEGPEGKPIKPYLCSVRKCIGIIMMAHVIL